MKCRHCLGEVEPHWSFCPHCSAAITADNKASAATVVPVNAVGVPVLPSVALSREEQLRIVRDNVQLAVQKGLEEFFSTEPKSSEAVWMMTSENGRSWSSGDDNVVMAQKPRVRFHRPENLEDAQRLLQRALEIVQGCESAGIPSHFACIRALTEVLQVGGKTRDAVEAARKALEWAESKLNEHAPDRALYLNLLARWVHQAHQVGCVNHDNHHHSDKARELHQVVQALIKDAWEADWTVAYETILGLARDYLAIDDFNHAEEYVKQAVTVAEALFGKEHPETAIRRFHLGRLYRDLSSFQNAEEALREALRCFGKVHYSEGDEHPYRDRVRDHYLHLLVDLKIDKNLATEAADRVLDGRDPGIVLPFPYKKDKLESTAGVCPLDFDVACIDSPKSLRKGQQFFMEITAKARDDVANPDKPKENGENELGTQISFQFSPSKVEFVRQEPIPPRIDWKGTHESVRFHLVCPFTVAEDTCRETVEVFAEGIRIGSLQLDLHFSDRGSDPKSVISKFEPVRSAYACYAPEDRYEALGRIQGVKRVLPEMELTVNLEPLRSLDPAGTKLLETINHADHFLLFWSARASTSHFVNTEWHHARTTKGIGSIDVVLIERDVELPADLQPALKRALAPAEYCKREMRRALPGLGAPAMTSIVTIKANHPGFRDKLEPGQQFTLEIVLELAPEIPLELDRSTQRIREVGTEVQLVFKPERLTLLDPSPGRNAVKWKGLPESFRFDLICPADEPSPTVREEIRLFVEGIPVGTIQLVLHFARIEDTPLVEAVFEAYRSGFACFAPEDRHDALGRLEGVNRIVPGYEVTSNLPELAPDHPQLKLAIEQSGRFILFWSAHAKHSDTVGAQWNSLVSAKRIGKIDAVWLEPNVAAPEELVPAFELALPLPRQEPTPLFRACCRKHPKSLPKDEEFTVEISLHLPLPGREESVAEWESPLREGVCLVQVPPRKEKSIWGVAGVTPPTVLESTSPKADRKQVFQLSLSRDGDVTGPTCWETLYVYCEGVLVGELQLELHFEEAPWGGDSVRCEFHPSLPAYVCHAPQDNYEVLARLQAVKATLPDLRFAVLDEKTRSNTGSVQRAIQEADRFLLFCSSRAIESPLVKNELNYFRSCKGIDAPIHRVEIHEHSGKPAPRFPSAPECTGDGSSLVHHRREAAKKLKGGPLAGWFGKGKERPPAENKKI